MKIKVDEKYQAVIIELKGNLVGGETARNFRENLYKIISENKKHIVVDMSDVKMVNSSGIGILISGYTTVKNSGGDLRLAGISNNVEGVLNITKLNQIFKLYPNVDDAVRSYDLSMAQ